MKIGITTFGGDGGKSGISRYIIQLIKQFSQSHNDIQWDIFGYANEEKIFLPENSSMQFIPCSEKLRSPVVNIAWHQTKFPKLCKKNKYDLVFLPAANRRVATRIKCPTVGTVHDFSSIHVKGKYDMARMFYIKKVLPKLIQSLDWVLTVSESSKKDIVEYACYPEDQITVTPLAANQEEYSPRPKEQAFAAVGNKYSLKSPYILYVSRLEHPGKNHVRLIHAFEQAKKRKSIPHQLVLAGSDWLKAEEIHEAAKNSSACEDIVFTGFVHDGDLVNLYCAADLFIFPSLYEGFGLPVLEAMSCKIPVACSNISSMPEVAGDATLLFNPYEVDEIASSILQLTEDSNLQEQCRQKGAEQCAKFRWQYTAEKTFDIFQKVAQKG